MPDPRELIGTGLGDFSVLVETGAVQLFAKVVGVTDPRHIDPVAAARAGYPGVLAPPTYLFSLERNHPDPFALPRRLGIDIGSVLHGEQSFVYRSPVFAGDEVLFRPRFANYYERKEGALRFLVRDTTVSRHGAVVAELRNVLVARASDRPS